MLRQLLSTNGDDMGLNKPIGIDFHAEQHEYKTLETIPQNNTYYYPVPTEYSAYAHHPSTQPQQQSVIQSPYLAYQPPGAIHYDVPPTSTSDLYSSTYAMLSNDGIPTHSEWAVYPSSEKHQLDMYTQNNSASYQSAHLQYPQQSVVVGQGYIAEGGSGQTLTLQPPHPQLLQYSQYYPSNYQSNLEQTQPSTSSESSSRPSTADPKNRRPSVTARSAQQAYSESFRKIAKIPGSQLEEDEERVMCLACKGVYSSRRSLTGHIGRNEKCREVIGRTYISTLAQTGQSEILPDPGSVEGGISPVCPNCDRFISHYKGNIRRHINQCVKRPVRDHKTGSNLQSSVKTMAQHYASIAPIVTKDNPAYHQLAVNDVDVVEYQAYNGGSNGNSSSSMRSTVSEKKVKSHVPSNIAVQSSNPYNCSWCKFSTVYKGNMKRHLISVHNCTDELLRNISFDLERLRALATNRPVTPLCPQPEKIRGCSGRRRKCHPKKDSPTEDGFTFISTTTTATTATATSSSKKMKLLGDNEEPPAAVSDVIASFATLNNNCIKFIEEPVAASHDSGISSGSSIDEL